MPAQLMKYLGPFLWSLVLVVLYFLDTSSSQSLCIFKFMGFDSCPGCGLGHAIHDVLHWNLRQSIQEHILGIPATISIVLQLLKPFHFFTKTTHRYGSKTAYDASGIATR